MLSELFNGLFDTSQTAVIAVSDFLLCLGSALVCGLVLALAHLYGNRCTKSFAITLALLPAVVCVVIMVVNGNVGVGVAVAGAFSLVRFRSAPGTGEEISVIFMAMGAGLLTGMGYLGYAFLFTLLMSLISMLYNRIGASVERRDSLYRTLRITIPEDLDYTGVFDDLFETYTTSCTLSSVKTTNMGSLFRLTYDLTLKDAAREKELLDQLRCRNGNLEITISRQENHLAEL
ncbi:MAG: DUF4956 domain-containing protein [Clostridiales bacterium]|nr:DUF4956 domain-containing protein [Clostridiales bacterium]